MEHERSGGSIYAAPMEHEPKGPVVLKAGKVHLGQAQSGRTLLSIYLFLDAARQAAASGDLQKAKDTLADTLDQLWRLLSDDEHKRLDARLEVLEVAKARQAVYDLEYRLEHAKGVRQALYRQSVGQVQDVLNRAATARYDEAVIVALREAIQRCDDLQAALHDARVQLVRLEAERDTP
jgi:hypothetical protein